jgi:hypothetical protein
MTSPGITILFPFRIFFDSHSYCISVLIQIPIKWNVYYATTIFTRENILPTSWRTGTAAGLF